MNILVCIRQVPSIESPLRPIPSPPFIDIESVSWAINPFDELALEEAIRIKERLGKGEVTALTLGPERAGQILLNALAMGADRAVHIKEDVYYEMDSSAVSSLLAEVIRGKTSTSLSDRLPYDIILCGKEAIDDRQGAVGIELAELLDIPHVAVITRLDIDTTSMKATAKRQIEGAWEIVECTLPAVFTCQKGLNEPRYPSLPGIMKAKKKPLQEVKGIKAPAPKLSLIKIEPLPQRKPGRKLEAEAGQMAEELLRLLHEEARVI